MQFAQKSFFFSLVAVRRNPSAVVRSPSDFASTSSSLSPRSTTRAMLSTIVIRTSSIFARVAANAAAESAAPAGVKSAAAAHAPSESGEIERSLAREHVRDAAVHVLERVRQRVEPRGAVLGARTAKLGGRDDDAEDAARGPRASGAFGLGRSDELSVLVRLTSGSLGKGVASYSGCARGRYAGVLTSVTTR